MNSFIPGQLPQTHLQKAD